MKGLMEELRQLAGLGGTKAQEAMLEAAEAIESLMDQNDSLVLKVQQQGTQIDVLKGMVTLSIQAAGSSRTIDEIREQCMDLHQVQLPLFNAFEIRQCIVALDISESRHATLQVAYDQIDVSDSARSVKQIVDALNNNLVGPFSFKEVTSLREYFTGQDYRLGRPAKTNIKEILDLIKNGTPTFYAEEVRMVRQWGQDHERNAESIKRRFGRAFTDPAGFMDNELSIFLPAATKKAMLENNLLNPVAFQRGLFFRPDALIMRDDWRLCDGKTQFHAGKLFHTDPTTGLWGSGYMPKGLTAAKLTEFLEVSLAELRLLYAHFPEGINEPQRTAS